MTKEEVLSRIKKKFDRDIGIIREQSPRRVYIDLKTSQSIKAICAYMFSQIGARFITASASDNLDAMEVMYHFSLDSSKTVLTFKAVIDRAKPVIDSITPVITGAEWIEREMHELFGIDFKGHPCLKPLLLREDWPTDKNPMRKDYKIE